jgi:sialate O-acetylesterase
MFTKKILLGNFPTWKSTEFKGNKAVLTLEFAEGLHFKNKTSDQFEMREQIKNS